MKDFVRATVSSKTLITLQARSFLSLLFTVFVIGSCLVLVTFSRVEFFLAFLINLGVATPTVIWLTLLKPKLQNSYFTPKKWEREGKIYSILGIGLFKSFLIATRWNMLTKWPRARRVYSELREMENYSRIAEFSHGLSFLVVMLVAIYSSALGDFKGGIYLITIGVLIHLYPAMLQRYNRPRYCRILDAMELHEKPKD